MNRSARSRMILNTYEICLKTRLCNKRADHKNCNTGRENIYVRCCWLYFGHTGILSDSDGGGLLLCRLARPLESYFKGSVLAWKRPNVILLLQSGAREARSTHTSIIRTITTNPAFYPGEHQDPGDWGRRAWLWAPQKLGNDGIQVAIRSQSPQSYVVNEIPWPSMSPSTVSPSGTLTWLTWTQSTCPTSTGSSSSGSPMWASSRLRYSYRWMEYWFEVLLWMSGCGWVHQQAHPRMQGKPMFWDLLIWREIFDSSTPLKNLIFRWRHTTARFRTLMATSTANSTWWSAAWIV